VSPRDALTCDEFKELAPAYALIALDDEEREACARHLGPGTAHRGCREAVAEAEMVAARLGAALAPRTPSAHVWGAIAARIRAGECAPAVADDAAGRRSLYHLCGLIVAAALVGLYLYNAPPDHLVHLRSVLSAGSAPTAAH
jgi:anti-sigma-K factor RskA